MPRGGYQKPKNPAPASGPGKFSKRTDGQATAVPNVGDSPDLQYGDRGMLEGAQRIAPASGAQGARVRPQRNLTGSVAQGKLPPWFFSSEDTAPDEPSTAGIDMGAGPGSEALMAQQPAEDQQEVVLQFLAETYHNQDAIAMLNQKRMERGESMAMATPSGPSLDPALPETPTEA
jgi:hypothetical protein